MEDHEIICKINIRYGPDLENARTFQGHGKASATRSSKLLTLFVRQLRENRQRYEYFFGDGAGGAVKFTSNYS